MATAVKHELKASPPPYEIVLRLSQEEAEMLRLITGYVTSGGRSREITDAIFHALVAANVGSPKDFWINTGVRIDG